MIRIERLTNGYSARWLAPAGYFPCFGAADLKADQLLSETLAKNGLTDAHSLRREEHRANESCLLHGEGYCFSKEDLG